MPIVFVHGVPETASYWDPLRSLIDEPTTAVALPGFGCPRPEGFGATKDDYAAWLGRRLEDLAEPVDLVGHDWGAGLTYRIATTRPELIRSWAADVATIVHPDQVWHNFARIWQTPGEGEAFVQTQLATPLEDQIPVFEAMGLPRDAATDMLGKMDQTMGDCILDLYRSATPNTYATWGADMGPTGVPGLVIHATEDPFDDARLCDEVAAILGAEVGRLDGLAHFWAAQDPEASVHLLGEFWASLP
ncbi:MAG: alpha/beta hydrolase [Acidimicrobiia bacterium]|nr:alpha/beta hydrolase [Acidimicrobiia bacterium]